MTNRTFLTNLVIFLATIASVTLINLRGVPAVVQTNFENLPMEIAGYTATEDFFQDAIYEVLNADKHVYRHYRNAHGQQVDLYIGYYGTAKGGRTGHNPYACLPGAGWGILDTRKVTVSAKYYPQGVKVNYILARKGDTYETVLHWYQSARTKVLATGIQRNIQRFLGRIILNRNEGAFVRVSVFSDERQREKARSMVTTFAEQVLVLLPQYWPIEE
jgi:EpsI family protein